jgi:magnesium-transporting ATPase (P-type)
MFYSVFPMFYFAIFDREYETELYTERPEIYLSGLESKYFNNKIFWKNILLGFIEGLMITINSCFFYEMNNKGYNDDDVVSLGIIVFSGVVVAINVKVLLRVCVFDFILIIFVLGSVGLFYFTIFLFSANILEELIRFVEFQQLLDNIMRDFNYSNILGTNEYLINQRKYFVFFLFVIFVFDLNEEDLTVFLSLLKYTIFGALFEKFGKMKKFLLSKGKNVFSLKLISVNGISDISIIFIFTLYFVFIVLFSFSLSSALLLL